MPQFDDLAPHLKRAVHRSAKREAPPPATSLLHTRPRLPRPTKMRPLTWMRAGRTALPLGRARGRGTTDVTAVATEPAAVTPWASGHTRRPAPAPHGERLVYRSCGVALPSAPERRCSGMRLKAAESEQVTRLLTDLEQQEKRSAGITGRSS